MSKGKLAKFADMAANPLVIECPITSAPGVFAPGAPLPDFALRGRWHEDFFHNQNPIVLELGCGRGEYTVGLGRQFPEKNFIGVDIKGARMWTGAQDALQAGMKNVAFLRTNIEFIHFFFAASEVSEIWLTFSDPQMKKATKRLTSSYFLERYRRFLLPDGLIHLKTDSNFLFTYTEELLKANRLPAQVCTRSLYDETGDDTRDARAIQTYYESMWRSRGIDIKYLRFPLPSAPALIEPDIEIPLDEYRSYNRSKRSGNETGR